MTILFPQEEFNKVKEYLFFYQSALKTMETRMQILHNDFSEMQDYNPIEHIKCRLKSPESIADKLHRLGQPITADAAKNVLMDIAGMRCICSYTKDISIIVNVLKAQPDLKIILEKNYITRPKPNGYRSYHIILDVPIYLVDKIEHLPVEIQIRTQAMDFWASLEHKVRYKYKGEMPNHLLEALKVCAEEIARLDDRMYKIQEIVEIAY